MTNPDIKAIDDPFFDLDNLGFWTTNSHTFDGITDLRDPSASPLYMETDVLKVLADHDLRRIRGNRPARQPSDIYRQLGLV